MIDGKRAEKVPTIDEIAALVRQRTENFYEAHKLCCSESVALVLNQGLGGGLPPEVAVRLGSGFCGGMGDAGCTCGGLSGAVMILGLFLGPGQPGALSKKELRKTVKKMHDSFQDRAGSTCCRVLLEKVKHDRKNQRENCMGLTGLGAELATSILLEARPDLSGNLDLEFLRGHDSRLGCLVQKVLGLAGKK
ncbi:MAG: C-GCAxxG-C-C family protein [Proteobacteria bacterium]|nr:C-GCAxxG-C-C family protein [Pseudomonadota bacterium]MBU1715889.1 C-GCAxxG-C-C family protein [Pseudomonadota bacterium]